MGETLMTFPGPSALEAGHKLAVSEGMLVVSIP